MTNYANLQTVFLVFNSLCQSGWFALWGGGHYITISSVVALTHVKKFMLQASTIGSDWLSVVYSRCCLQATHQPVFEMKPFRKCTQKKPTKKTLFLTPSKKTLFLTPLPPKKTWLRQLIGDDVMRIRNFSGVTERLLVKYAFRTD